jgi:hypothetical protein
VIYEVDRKYLEALFRVPPVHSEGFDRHGASLVFSIAHVCKTPIVLDLFDVDVLLLKFIRRRYDRTRLADLPNKPQAPPAELSIEV